MDRGLRDAGRLSTARIHDQELVALDPSTAELLEFDVDILLYKNAALIEKQHPMIAGFLPPQGPQDPPAWLPDRLLTGASVEAGERNTVLLVTWQSSSKKWRKSGCKPARRVKLRSAGWTTAKSSSRHLAGLRIGEIQQIYNNAKESLPDRVTALLEPLEDLSSRCSI